MSEPNDSIGSLLNVGKQFRNYLSGNKHSAYELEQLKKQQEARAKKFYYNREGAGKATENEVNKEAVEDHITSPQEAFGVDDIADKPVSCLYYPITSILVQATN